MSWKAPRETDKTRLPLGVQVYSVAELNRDARQVLEDGLPALWVAGEISNLARPGSGHIYFSLKDAAAQVRCAMFRNANRSLKFSLEDGLQVLVRAKVTIYEPRGSYQLIVEHMEPAGEGLLRRRLEELKTKLATEGLFDSSHKQPLPGLPQRIGIITSPTGAAVRDILHILRRRFATVPVVIYPVQVQGDKAKHEIVDAIRIATTRNECDVLILGRGGGSLEDLWAFNEEPVRGPRSRLYDRRPGRRPACTDPVGGRRTRRSGRQSLGRSSVVSRKTCAEHDQPSDSAAGEFVTATRRASATPTADFRIASAQPAPR
jgi:hypothetical protein